MGLCSKALSFAFVGAISHLLLIKGNIMAIQSNQTNTNTNKPLEQAAGWYNLTIIDAEGNQIEEIGGLPLKDSNPIHAAINAAGGEMEDGYYIHVKWNSGVPKKPKADLSHIFKRK